MQNHNFKDYTDYEIIELCIKGDQEAFSQIISRYKNLVYSVILRMVCEQEEANDLAQEVFTKVYKNIDKYHPEFKFSTWVIRITTNHVIDYRRKKKQDSVSISEMTQEPTAKGTPESDYLRKELRETVVEAIELLPDMYKIPIVLYHQQGLTYQEISKIINEPLSKVKNRIFRGRKILKETLMKMKVSEAYGL